MDDRAIVEAIASEMRTGAVVLDYSFRILYANPFFVGSFSPAKDPRGLNIGDIMRDEALLNAIGAPTLPTTEDIEINESGRSFSVRMVRLVEGGEGSGGDLNLLLFLRDITEEKRVEAIKKDFVANVSHELRTPLASIKGYSETLLEGGLSDTSTAKDFLGIIDKHATRMSRLIDDLLILSRLESHQLPVESVALDMAELLKSTISGFQKQAEDKGIELTAELSEGFPRVLGDRDRIEQVLVNLLDNAVKYTQSGGSVSAVGYEDSGEVRIDVADTGMGIPAKDMPRIFERFYRVDKARSRELGGTGLGLAIVKHIVHGLGGRVWVESKPGKGSCFSFTLRSAAKGGAQPGLFK